MSIPKFLLMAALITIVGLGYVHQQTELLIINYTIYYNRDNLAILLDQNSALVYNVDSLASPFSLENKLAEKNVSLVVPARWYTIGSAEAARETVR